jgi:L-ribulose-5-phosphate 4-epimerase
MGTTHADYFRGDIPITRPLTQPEVERDYERNTGLVIVETFRSRGISPDEIPAVLVVNHASFAWGADCARAIEHAQVLELVARMEWRARALSPGMLPPRPDGFLVDKHFLRKHGPSATYGQR